MLILNKRRTLPGGEPTKIVTNVITFEMQLGKCIGKRNKVKYLDPLTLMAFPLHLALLKYVSRDPWLKSLIVASH